MDDMFELPHTWTLASFGEIATITRLAGAEYSDYWKTDPNGEIIALRGNNIQENRLVLDNCERISAQLSQKLIRSKLHIGDIVFPCVGSIGKAAVIKENNKFHINQNIAKITPHAADSDYLAHFLLSPLSKNQILAFNTSTSQPSVLVENLRKFQIPLPPLAEQRQIAAILSTWDETITRTTQLIAALQRRKQALMQLLLTGAVRFPGFEHSEWEEKRIAELGKIVTGNTPSMNSPQYYQPMGFPWVSPADITKQGNRIKDSKTKLSDLGKKAARIVPRGSVLVTCIGSIGKNAVTDVDVAINQQINAIVVNENFDYRFIFYQIEHNVNKILEYVGTTSVPIINKSTFEKIVLDFPTEIDEQAKIGTLLELCDSHIHYFRQDVTFLQTQKRGLMQQLLTGAVRVPLTAS